MQQSMNIAFIPAREGSKRFPGKNMIILGGKPLIQWSIESTINSGVFDKIIVSSDWKLLLKKMGKKFKKRVEFRERVKEFSLDTTPTNDVIEHELREFKGNNQFCLLEPTSPIRHRNLIKETLFEFTPEYNSLFTINRYNLQEANGLIYWFRDPSDIWKAPTNIFPMEPQIDIDHVAHLRIAEYILRGGKI